ncbi:MAG: aspartate-semialdehyde dehydrogenase [bacterium]|nr:aspartate-semialdehyde dehydrogenase [bacterium]
MKKYKVAIVGATGAVGNQMKEILQEHDFPIEKLYLFSSSRSAGKVLEFKEEQITVKELTPDSFEGIEIALFSAGSKTSKEYVPYAVNAGCVVIDNSSAFRMQSDVPLVVPEINPFDLKWHKGIIANPNCSTIQMVMVLKPLYDRAGIKRVVVSTYQSTSGTGWKAMIELREQCEAIMNKKEVNVQVYPYQIAFNVIPQIGAFLPNGYTEEELKMVNETRKILGDETIAVSATTVRVPVFISHCETVNVELKQKLTASQAKDILSSTIGVKVVDNPEDSIYPYPLMAKNKDEVYVGRIREDLSVPFGLDMWIVADNLRKGAALNAVQIAEKMIKLRLI